MLHQRQIIGKLSAGATRLASCVWAGWHPANLGLIEGDEGILAVGPALEVCVVHSSLKAIAPHNGHQQAAINLLGPCNGMWAQTSRQH